MSGLPSSLSSSLSPWLADLGAAAEAAASAEDAYRRDFARRVAALAEARAFAFRRANLVRALADAIDGTQDEPAALSHGLAVLRTRLGWSSDSEARAEILAHFAPVCAAMFGAAAPPAPEAARPGPGPEAPDPAAALAAFESWYRQARGSAFWVLFENVIPETPLVDF